MIHTICHIVAIIVNNQIRLTHLEEKVSKQNGIIETRFLVSKEIVPIHLALDLSHERKFADVLNVFVIDDLNYIVVTNSSLANYPGRQFTSTDPLSFSPELMLYVSAISI